MKNRIHRRRGARLKKYYLTQAQLLREAAERKPSEDEAADDGVSFEVIFLRANTQTLFRRYCYASLMLSRVASSLPSARSAPHSSCRPVNTFEDALIFVVDMERCIARLNPIDRGILTRVIKQSYSASETAALLGLPPGALHTRFPRALDRLTQELLKAGLLISNWQLQAA
jgi:DNA-directed RNA polymerase specialized sigma24 family protein